MVPGMISRFWSPRCHSTEITSGHEAQDAAGALEPVERRPVLVEPVEQLRVDRVRQLHPPPVLGLTDLAREVSRLLAVVSRRTP
jgi:hypothetical protein